MSDEEALADVPIVDEIGSVAFFPGDWWWIAPIVFHSLLDEIKRGEKETEHEASGRFEGISQGCALIVQRNNSTIYRVKVCKKGNGTAVIVGEPPDFKGLWARHAFDISIIVNNARTFRRLALGVQFEEILDVFYAMRSKPDAPTLRQLADDARVNYGSLRQYKIGYDEKRRAKKV